MEEEKIKRKIDILHLCNRIHSNLNENQEDAYSFFGGELYKTYVETTDKVKDRVENIKYKIENL